MRLRVMAASESLLVAASDSLRSELPEEARGRLGGARNKTLYYTSRFLSLFRFTDLYPQLLRAFYDSGLALSPSLLPPEI